MGVFDNQIALAVDLIERNGKLVKIRRYAETPVDPDQPWLGSTRTSMDEEVRAVFLPTGYTDYKAAKYRQGETDQRGMEEVYIAAGEVAERINKTDRIVRNGVEMEIMWFDLISPNGEDILYILQVAS